MSEYTKEEFNSFRALLEALKRFVDLVGKDKCDAMFAVITKDDK